MRALFLAFWKGATPARRYQFIALTGLIVVSGLIELAALGSVALFITSLTSPEEVMGSRYLALVRDMGWGNLSADTRTFYLVLGGITLVLVVWKNMAAGLQTYLIARFDGLVNVDYGCKLLRGFLELPYEWGGGKNSSDLLSYLGWRLYAGAFVTHATTLLSESVVSVLLIVALFVLQPATTLLVMLVLGVLGGGVFFIVKSRISALALRVRELVLSVNRVSMQSVQGLKDVKLFNATSESVDFFGREQVSFVRKIALQRVYERVTVWVLETVGFGGLVLGALSMLVTTEATSTEVMGTLSLLAVSAWRILPAMHRSVAVFGYIQGYTPFLTKMRELVDEIEANERAYHDITPVALPLMEQDIHFEHVCYQYPSTSQPALSDLAFRIPKGSLVGIVGHSGAGKSTLADLLAGLLLPTAGHICIDGQELNREAIRSWREQVGVVSQTPYLFDGSLAENVAFTVDAERIDLQRVRVCCEQAGLNSLWPEGHKDYTMMVGERGGKLSGGQAQRVVIARALYKSPSLLIFDEATSSLDDKTERLIRDTIENLRSKMTIVVIAHRLQTVQDCDMVVWIEGGRIVDCGPADTILLKYCESSGEEKEQRNPEAIASDGSENSQ